MDIVGTMGTTGAMVAVDDAAPPAPAGGSRARTGAPPIYAALIIESLMDASRGHRRSLRSICQDLGLDGREVHGWMIADPEFMQDYELARRYRFDDMAEECLEIADDTAKDDIIGPDGFRRPNKEWIARSRVRINTRLDLLARWDPARYGAKLEVNANNRNLNINVDLSADPTEAARQYSDIMRAD